MRRLPAVCASAWAMASRTAGATPLRSPATQTRTPARCSSARCLRTATSISSISAETSSAGRLQFSEENANTVRYSMPRSALARTMRSRLSTPALWP